MMKSARIHTDGASRNNPGNAGAGFVISTPRGKILFRQGVHLGIATNNVAEYTAALLGLQKALQLNIETVVLYSDSELMIRQLTGVYKIKDPALKVLAAKITALTPRFQSVEFKHIPREQNREADRLSTLAADRVQTAAGEIILDPTGDSADRQNRLF